MHKNKIPHRVFPLAPLPFDPSKVVADAHKKFDVKSYTRMHGHDYLSACLTSTRHKSALDQVYFEFPNMQNAVEKLADYLTDLAPSSDDDSLLRKCVVNGIKGFSSKKREAFLSSNETLKLKGFIQGVSSSFNEVLLFDIYGQTECGSWLGWKPLSEPISYWLSTNKFVNLIVLPSSHSYDEIDTNIASNKMMYSIFEYSDLALCDIGAIEQSFS